jgi:hypothetical protein
MNTEHIPTTERLARALEAAGAPQDMINMARAGYYDDFKSDHATPIVLLVQDAQAIGLKDIVDRAIDGEFDATKEEGDEWMQSPEGQEVLQSFLGPIQPKPKNPYSSRMRYVARQKKKRR